MSLRWLERRRQALLVGLVCTSVGLGCWIMWGEMLASAGHSDGIAPGAMTITESGGACVLAEQGVPCSTPGSMSIDEWESLTTNLPPRASQITWLGHLVIGLLPEGGRYVSTPVLPEYELGLREDGVLVWRKKEEKQ